MQTMELWLEELLSGWPAEQRSEVEQHVREGSFISFRDGTGLGGNGGEIQEWESGWAEDEVSGWVEGERQEASFRPVRMKLPPGLNAAALRKAALLRGVAVGSEPDNEDVILLSFGGLGRDQILEGLSRLAEEVAAFTARSDS